MQQIPIMVLEQPRQHNAQRDIVMVPARVDKAMEFLHLMMAKQTDKPTGGDQGHTIDGLKLTDEESIASATACNLLNKYFAGQLPADDWDKLRLRKAKAKKRRVKRYCGKAMSCPNCNGSKGHKDCGLCNGAGRILINPLES